MNKEIVTKGQNQVSAKSVIGFQSEGDYQFTFGIAQSFASSKMVPKDFQGKPADCAIALIRAQKLDIDPFTFMENAYVVYGKIALSGKLIIMIMNNSDKIKGKLKFKYERDDSGKIVACTCFAKDVDGDTLEYTVTWNDVVQNKWHLDKSGNPCGGWIDYPQKMFTYRSASWLVDLYFPEVVSGMKSVEDLQDSHVEEIDHEDVTDLPDLGKPALFKGDQIEKSVEVTETIKEKSKVKKTPRKSSKKDTVEPLDEKPPMPEEQDPYSQDAAVLSQANSDEKKEDGALSDAEITTEFFNKINQKYKDVATQKLIAEYFKVKGMLPEDDKYISEAPHKTMEMVVMNFDAFVKSFEEWKAKNVKS